MQDWRCLASGGFIICKVSSRDLHLAQSSIHLLNPLLIHFLEFLQEKAQVMIKSIFWSCKQVKGNWTFNLELMEAPKISELSIPSQSQNLLSLFMHLGSKLKSKLHLANLAQNLVFLKLARHPSWSRNILHMHKPQPSTPKLESNQEVGRIKNIGSVDNSTEYPPNTTEHPLILNLSRNQKTEPLYNSSECPPFTAEHPLTYKARNQRNPKIPMFHRSVHDIS